MITIRLVVDCLLEEQTAITVPQPAG